MHCQYSAADIKHSIFYDKRQPLYTVFFNLRYREGNVYMKMQLPVAVNLSSMHLFATH